MKKTLVVLAAGIGSRFGGGIKQLEPIDDYGHIIIDYSIHDAINAGFNKIVFIIRHDIEEDFKNIIGNRIEKIIFASSSWVIPFFSLAVFIFFPMIISFSFFSILRPHLRLYEIFYIY